MLELIQTDVLQGGDKMTLSLEQKEELSKLIKKKEIQLRRKNIHVRTGYLWCKAILILLNGGNYQAVLQTLKSYPQESWFVA